MMRRIRLLVVPLLGAALAACGPGKPDPEPISIMTFNIRYGTADDGEDSWPNRSAMVVDLIREQAPDILGVQEALRFQLDELRAALPEYAELGVGRDDGLEAGEYSAILYDTGRFAVEESGTFWLSDSPDTPGSMSWGNRITRICTWVQLEDRATEERFYVYNLHLDHESQVSRVRSVGLLAMRMAERPTAEPVVVLGDFNAGKNNAAIRFLTGASDSASEDVGQLPPSPQLSDTYGALYRSTADVGTFNAFRGETSGEQIDWILVSDGWEVLEAAIVRTNDGGRYPSDHFPVTARVMLRR